MKTITIEIGDDAYKKLRSEAMSSFLCHGAEGSMISMAWQKVFAGIEAGVVPQLMTKKDKEAEA